MSSLKQQLIRIGNRNPSLRKHLRPVIQEIKREKVSNTFRQFMHRKNSLDLELEKFKSFLNAKVDTSLTDLSLDDDVKEIENKMQDLIRVINNKY